MTRRVRLLVFLFVTFATHSLCTGARAQDSGGGFEVTSPRSGASVEMPVDVKGTAKLPEGYHLWVFVRRIDFDPFWWPQNEGRVDEETGKWRVQVTVGAPQDVGWDFEIAVAVFQGNAHFQLREYRREAMRTGEWRPIEMPETAMPPQIIKIRKVGNSS